MRAPVLDPIMPASQRRSPDADAEPTTRSIGTVSRSLALHLAPALVAIGLLVDVVDGIVGFVLAFGVLLLAPGWLLWRVTGGVVSDEPPALPAVWLVLSFLVLSPVLAGTTYFGWRVVALETYALVVLAGLGIAASFRPVPRISWERPDRWMVVAGLGALAYRSVTWQNSADSLTYLGYIRRVVSDGAYPSVNPFLAGDIPLAPRWRLGGWTGLTGILARLGDADPAMVFVDALPPLLLVVAASSLYLLARELSGSRRFARIAAIAGLLVPLLTAASGKTEFKFWYKSIAQDKYAALVVFLPAVAALLIRAVGARRIGSAVIAAGALWAMMFVHPLPALLTLLSFGALMALDVAINRRSEWRPAAGWSAAVVAPFVLTALVLSLGGKPFGTRLGDIDDLSDVAAPARSIGPIEIWSPIPPGGILDANPEDAEAIFIQGHTYHSGPKLAYLSNGMPFAHPEVLGDPANLIALLAVAVIVFGRHRGLPALWILATSGVAISVFILPPFAALVGRFVTPWQLWRFSWLFPIPFSVAWLISLWLPRARWPRQGALAIGVVLGLVFASAGHGQVLRTEERAKFVREDALAAQFAGYEGVLLAEDAVAPAVATWPDLEAVSYRGLTAMSNGFPSARRLEGFQRFQDARMFFARRASTEDRIEILDRYGVDLVVIHADDEDQFDLDALGLVRVESIDRGLTIFARSG